MSKAKNQANDQSVESDVAEDDSNLSAMTGGRRDDDPNELGFAAGDLGRIQGILLGDHARRIDGRLSAQQVEQDQKIHNLVAQLELTNQTLKGEIEVLKSELAEERDARLEAMRLATEDRAALSHQLDLSNEALAQSKADADAARAELKADSIAMLDDLGSRLDSDVSTIQGRLDDQGVERSMLSDVLRHAAATIDRSTSDESDQD